MLTSLEHRMPGVTADRTATPRQLDVRNAVYVGGIINGANTRDAENTPAHDLRAGTLMGLITATKKWAPSIIGLAGEAMDGDETAMTVPAGVDVEIVRRIGASGTFKLIGPPTAAGTSRTVTVTYSSVDTGTHVVTITAMGTSEVQAIAAEGAGYDAGTFKVLNPEDDAISAAIALSDDGAAVQTKLRVMGGNMAAVTVAGNAGGPYTVTWPQKGATSGPHSLLRVVGDATIDNPIWEGGFVVRRITAGVNGDFVTKSIIAPTDGSETPLAVFTGIDNYPLRVINEDGVSRDCSYDRLLVSSDYFVPSQLVNWPDDASLRAWVKAQLRAAGPWVFNDLFV